MIVELYLDKIQKVFHNLKPFIYKTPLQYNNRLSQQHGCNIFLKREDLQLTRSYKVRGCLNKLLKNKDRKTIISASAGNHAQGIAYFSNRFKLNSTIFLPKKTPYQKINMINYYGNKFVNLNFIDGIFDHSLTAAEEYANKHDNSLFIHPFNDYDIIEGASTVAYEIYNNITPDYLICPVGGGGLLAGISKYSKNIWDSCSVVAVEPQDAASLKEGLKYNYPIKLNNIDMFVDGASVAQIGDKTFYIIRDNIDFNITVENSEIVKAIIDMYNYEGIILEPAGALSIAALDNYKFNSNDIVVCIVSGGNNDLDRYQYYKDYII